jgi:hypothetical protein
MSLDKAKNDQQELASKASEKAESLLKDSPSKRQEVTETYSHKLETHLKQINRLLVSPDKDIKDIGEKAVKSMLREINTEYKNFLRTHPDQAREKADLLKQSEDFNRFLESKIRNYEGHLKRAEQVEKDLAKVDLLKDPIAVDTALKNYENSKTRDSSEKILLSGITASGSDGSFSINLKSNPEKAFVMQPTDNPLIYELQLNADTKVTVLIGETIADSVKNINTALRLNSFLIQADIKSADRKSQCEQILTGLRELSKNPDQVKAEVAKLPQNVRGLGYLEADTNSLVFFTRGDKNRTPYFLEPTGTVGVYKIDGKPSMTFTLGSDLNSTLANFDKTIRENWEEEFKKDYETNPSNIAQEVDQLTGSFDQVLKEIQSVENQLNKTSGEQQNILESKTLHLKNLVNLYHDQRAWSSMYKSNETSGWDIHEAIQAVDKSRDVVGSTQSKLAEKQDTLAQKMSEMIESTLNLALRLGENTEQGKAVMEAFGEWAAKQSPETQFMIQQKVESVQQIQLTDQLLASPQGDLLQLFSPLHEYFAAQRGGQKKIQQMIQMSQFLFKNPSLTNFSDLSSSILGLNPNRIAQISDQQEEGKTYESGDLSIAESLVQQGIIQSSADLRSFQELIREIDQLSGNTLLPPSGDTLPLGPIFGQEGFQEKFRAQLRDKMKNLAESDPHPLLRLQLIEELSEGSPYSSEGTQKYHAKLSELITSGEAEDIPQAIDIVRNRPEFSNFAKMEGYWRRAFSDGKGGAYITTGWPGGLTPDRLIGVRVAQGWGGEKITNFQDGVTASKLQYLAADILRNIRGDQESVEGARARFIALSQELIAMGINEHLPNADYDQVRREVFEKVRLDSYREMANDRTRKNIALGMAKQSLPEETQKGLSDDQKVERYRNQLREDEKDLDAMVEQGLLASAENIANKQAEAAVNQRILSFLLDPTKCDFLKDLPQETPQEKYQVQSLKQLQDSYGANGAEYDWSDETHAFVKWIGEEVAINAALLAVSGGIANVARAGVTAVGRMALRAAGRKAVQVASKEIMEQGAKAVFMHLAKTQGRSAALKWAAAQAAQGTALLGVEAVVFHETNSLLQAGLHGRLEEHFDQSFKEHADGWTQSFVMLGFVKGSGAAYQGAIGSTARMGLAGKALVGAGGIGVETVAFQAAQLDAKAFVSKDAWVHSFASVVALKAGGKLPHTMGIHKAFAAVGRSAPAVGTAESVARGKEIQSRAKEKKLHRVREGKEARIMKKFAKEQAEIDKKLDQEFAEKIKAEVQEMEKRESEAQSEKAERQNDVQEFLEKLAGAGKTNDQRREEQAKKEQDRINEFDRKADELQKQFEQQQKLDKEAQQKAEQERKAFTDLLDKQLAEENAKQERADAVKFFQEPNAVGQQNAQLERATTPETVKVENPWLKYSPKISVNSPPIMGDFVDMISKASEMNTQKKDQKTEQTKPVEAKKKSGVAKPASIQPTEMKKAA